MDLRFSSKDIQDSIDNIKPSHPIVQALNKGKLIIFVGAGMSVHLKVPGWREFALEYLDLVYQNNALTSMNYKTKESLMNEETKKILSICKYVADQNMTRQVVMEAYKKWFKVDIGRVKEKRLYEKLYDLNAIYITTNYDNALDLLAEQTQTGEINTEDNSAERIEVVSKGSVYYDIRDFSSDILKMGNVIHIHGSIKNCNDLVISYQDYIKRYGNVNKDVLGNFYSKFLSDIFNKDYVILFVGYGLEELEILQYLFEDELKGKNGESIGTRFLLLSCYSDEYYKINYFHNYYKAFYGINIIPYDITEKGYEKIEDFLDRLNELKQIDDVYEVKKADELIHGLRLIGEI